ncbi:U7 snRNA-associated Sm-like protein LSm11 [Pelobates fuscus]|uniref:U7 snRNA-associated Sm-like protein LSm11 n=1 Tax=Pelobates fuscus TaxID=191477 RepID=UPI002FE4AE36
MESDAATQNLEARAVQAEAGDQRDLMAEDEEDIAACRLDVSSESFDPLLALYTPHTPLPFPNVRCFNNLAEYESFLRGGGRGRARGQGTKKASRKGKQAPDPGRIERLKKLMLPEEEGATPPKPRRKKTPKNVLTRMPLHVGSPLGELNRCIQDRIRIKVHIRTFKGLRGVCSGFIIAFDKFWNMAMVDVDETYRKPVLGKAFYNEPQLTLNKLFEGLKLQESGLQSTGSGEDTSKKQLFPQTHPTDGKSKESRKLSSKPETSSYSADSASWTPEEDKKENTGKKQQTRHRKKKVDYQQVFTRHIKQVFIRGENILLINIGD